MRLFNKRGAKIVCIRAAYDIMVPAYLHKGETILEQLHTDIAYTLIDRPAMRAVGFKCMIRGKLQQRQAVAAAFWKELKDDGRLATLGNFGGGNPILGVSTNFFKDGYDFYVCVETEAAPPEGMEALEIPGGLFAAFPCESASPDAVRARWAEIYDKWFFRSGYGHLGTAEVEVYPKLDPQEPCELYAPVKKLEPKPDKRRGADTRPRDVFIMVLCGLLFLLLGSAVSGPSSVPLIFALIGLLVGVGINRYLKKRDEEKSKKDGNGE